MKSSAYLVVPSYGEEFSLLVVLTLNVSETRIVAHPEVGHGLGAQAFG